MGNRKRKRRVISKELERLLARAQKAYLGEKFDEAIPMLLEVIRQKPQLKAPYVTLATIHEELGELDKEQKYLIIAAQFDNEKDAEFFYEVAVKSRKIGKTEDVCGNGGV